MIESKGNAKSEVSYLLANILSKYKDQPEILRSKLPSYIIDAIEYVTEPLPLLPTAANTDTSQND
jgi:putative ATP-dependent endonuclease of OLD family